MDYEANHTHAASAQPPIMLWPTGPWLIWITLAGRLLVTAHGAPQPERTAFPLADANTRAAAAGVCRLIGRRRCGGEIVVDAFGGRFCDVIELQHRLAARRAGRAS